MDIRATTRTEAVLQELGRRVRRLRLERNQRQSELADEAGVGEATLRRLEAGESVNLQTFVRVLRALDYLSGLDAVLPEPLVSPIKLAERSGTPRQRASMPRDAEKD